ncbi:YbaN family protein [Siccirubricoccus phaeus]|uniref:YbaN family protein n=1 Tax=Siccirubricoccus phaeus TaxID=2595053 RepID=UPI0011F1AE8B|nr:YbaN family protein [Siccirubricoccus phaeus]
MPDGEETAAPPLRRPQRLALLGLGYLCLVLAAIGAVLPVMPTTIFLIIAAWAFGRASPTLQARLLNHPRFGPPLRAWRAHGVISRRGKRAALSVMTVSWVAMTLIFRHWTASAIAGACLLAVGGFLVTRPSEPPP